MVIADNWTLINNYMKSKEWVTMSELRIATGIISPTITRLLRTKIKRNEAEKKFTPTGKYMGTRIGMTIRYKYLYRLVRNNEI